MDAVYYLIKGTVYRELINDKGHESILSRKNNADVADALVGVLSLYNPTHGAFSRYNFIAHTDCTCYRIPGEVCKAYLRSNPELLERVIQHSMREYNQILNLFQTHKEGMASAKLCALLLERAKETEDGLRIVPRKCTNVELSKLLSVHKVTVSRMIRALREEGVVERATEGLVLLQPERLKRYAENKEVLIYE